MPRQYIPDQTDLEMLLLISQGGGKCAYLAAVFEMSKSAVSQRMIKLQDFGLIEIHDKSQRSEARDYELTTLGAEIIQTTKVAFQLQMLIQLKRTIA